MSPTYLGLHIYFGVNMESLKNTPILLRVWSIKIFHCYASLLSTFLSNNDITENERLVKKIFAIIFRGKIGAIKKINYFQFIFS